MKKLVYSISALFLAGSMFSCQEKSLVDDVVLAPVTLKFGIGGNDPSVTKAPGTVKPITAFKAGDVIDLLFTLSTDADCTFQLNKQFAVTQAMIDAATAGGLISGTVNDVPDTFTSVVAVMNARPDAGAESATAGVTSQQGLVTEDLPGSYNGQKLSELLFSLAPRTTPTTAGSFNSPKATTDPVVAAPSVFYSPKDFFVSNKATINKPGTGNSTVTVVLARAISMARIIMADEQNKAVNVGKLDFSNAKNGIMMRQTSKQTSLLVAGNAQAVSSENDGVLHLGSFQMIGKPATGYDAGTAVLSTAEVTGGKHAWQDFTILPHTGLAKKMNILIGIYAGIGYEPSNTTPLTAGAMVYFMGEVKTDLNINANSILRLNTKLINAGSTDPENPAIYGSLDVTASLEPWGDFVDVSLDI